LPRQSGKPSALPPACDASEFGPSNDLPEIQKEWDGELNDADDFAFTLSLTSVARNI
jgi:hypothetical protein